MNESIKRGIEEMKGWSDGTGTRMMKHHINIDGKDYTIEAATKEEFKEKLRKLQEHSENDGA